MNLALNKTQTSKIVTVIQKLFPLKYADSKWDNTGLLIDCSSLSNKEFPEIKVLLTIDLTQKVCQEAIDNECNFVLAYHPFIFPNWKQIDPTKNPQHLSALKLIHHGISVYSPHTSVDAVKNGVNDWLSNTLVGQNIGSAQQVASSESKVIEAIEEDIGYGRYLDLSKHNLDLQTVIGNVKKSLKVSHIQVSIPDVLSTTKHNEIKISNVALCAGSGSGVFRGLTSQQWADVDLLYTGELSHHEILKYKEMGKIVILCNHSNTERQYLEQVMIHELSKVDSSIKYHISAFDKDPLDTV